MLDLLRRFIAWTFGVLFGAAAEVDAGYRRKLLRKFCDAVYDRDWTTADRLHYKLYKKPYEIPKDRR